MFKRSPLVSSLLIIFFMSVAPVRAQYSFMYLYSSEGEDRPSGMIELSNGTFVVYGLSDHPYHAGYTYINNIGPWGSLNWEVYSPNKLGYTYWDCFQDKNGIIYAVGDYDLQALRNGGMTKLDIQGNVLLDTAYRVNTGASGGIDKIVQNDELQQFVSIGSGRPQIDVRSAIFQRTAYNGKRIWYKYVPLDEIFRIGWFFKHPDKEEYLLFSDKQVMKLDSIGTIIAAPTDILQDRIWENIRNLVQLSDGSFAGLINNGSKQHVQFMDKDGYTITKVVSVPNEGKFGAINYTKNKGIVLAGSHLLLYDSLMNVVTMKPLLPKGDTLGITSVAQAQDGGFYGCGESSGSYATRSYDIYAFKTTPEGDILHTGVREQSPLTGLKIYPNPSAGEFKVTGPFSGLNASIQDLLGRTLLKEQTISDNGVLDATALQNGIYFLVISDKINAHVQKITISK